MKITWLGQAGLLLKAESITILVDPYLSDSVGKIDPKNHRRVPVDERFFDIVPDIMIFTHDHLDHFDPETAEKYLKKTEKKITVLCPESVWKRARVYGGGHNYVQFNRLTEWTEFGIHFTAVHAEHSDEFAIGVIIQSDGKKYYVTGDTLYSKKVLNDLPEGIDVVFLPINGVGNNMNAIDAARFFEDCGAKKAVPLHVGMLDGLSPEIFEAHPRIIPKIYSEIDL